MKETSLKKYQLSIGRISKESYDVTIIEKIDKILKGQELGEVDYEKFLYPICANCNVIAAQYLLGKISSFISDTELVVHTVRFRNVKNDFETKQVRILELLFNKIDPQKKEDISNRALINTVWFGEYEATIYLIEVQKADTNQIWNGRKLLELAQNAVDKFNDDRVKKYLEELQ